MRLQELPKAYPAAATSLVAVIYVAVPISMLAALRELWAGGFLLLYLLVIPTKRFIWHHRMLMGNLMSTPFTPLPKFLPAFWR